MTKKGSGRALTTLEGFFGRFSSRTSVLICLALSLIAIGFLFLPLSCSASAESQSLADSELENSNYHRGDSLRFSLITDIHLMNTNFSVQVGGSGDYWVYGPREIYYPGNIGENRPPGAVRDWINGLHPAFVLDCGDMTGVSCLEAWEGYAKWAEGFNMPIYGILGNHDASHHNAEWFKNIDNETIKNKAWMEKNTPEDWPNVNFWQTYGTGYYTELGYNSATKVLKDGNMVFIQLSEEHMPECFMEYFRHLSPRRENLALPSDNYTPPWGLKIEHNLMSVVNNRMFRWLENQLAKYADNYNVFLMEHRPLPGCTNYNRGHTQPAHFEWTNRMKDLLSDYRIDFHLSGHTHWGSDITDGSTESTIPNNYFINFKSSGGHWPQEVFCAHYFDTTQGSDNIKLVTSEWSGSTFNQNVTDRASFTLRHPVQWDDGKLDMVDSMLTPMIMENLPIMADNWFRVPSGWKGRGVFSQGWSSHVNIKGIDVDAADGEVTSTRYKPSSDGGETWSDWQLDPPENVNALRLEVRFKAYGSPGGPVGPMVVDDIKVLTSEAVPPVAFDLSLPENNATVHNTPALRWGSSSDKRSGLDHYEVWIDGQNVENVAAGTTSYTPQELSKGIHSWRVMAVDKAGNERESEGFTFEVVEPAKFELSDLSVSKTEVEPGESTTVSVMVTNTGGERGSYTAEVSIGTETKTQEVTLDAGATDNVEFDLFENEEGTYEVSVGDFSKSFDVKEPGEGKPGKPEGGGGLPLVPMVAGGVAIAIAVIVAVIYWRR